MQIDAGLSWSPHVHNKSSYGVKVEDSASRRKVRKTGRWKVGRQESLSIYTLQ